MTPLHVASKWGRNNLVGLLIDNNAEMDGKTKVGVQLVCGFGTVFNLEHSSSMKNDTFLVR